MDTNDDIRRHRLEQLCLQHGGVRAVALKAGLKWQALDQVLKKVLLPAKADGSRSPRALGDDLARKLEAAYGLGEGWFDWPFDGVDFKKWAALDNYQRAFVQGQLSAAIDQAAAQRKLPSSMTKAPVSDKRVAQHYKTPGAWDPVGVPKVDLPDLESAPAPSEPNVKKRDEDAREVSDSDNGRGGPPRRARAS